MGVSVSGASRAGVVSIVSLSYMLFVFPFENSSVSSFIPDDSKWESGTMAEVATEKTPVSGLDSLFRVTGWPVVSFAASLFILLILCFRVQVFCFC